MSEIQIPTEEVITWRRHIHAHPEISYEESETAQYVENLLQSFGVETQRLTPTSVVGTLQGTAPVPAGKKALTVILRADMDALPLAEDTGEEFASTVPGVMHACGHDCHTAMLLGAAKTLAGMRDKFFGTVKFVFQHAEEKNPGGAVEIVRAGVCDSVDGAFALHVMKDKLGHVRLCKGAATSSAGGGYITIHGQGAHGSMPQESHDPLLAACEIVLALNTITSRNTDPTHMVVVNIGYLESSTKAPNVIGDFAKFGVSIRTVNDDDYQLCLKRITEICDGIAAANECTVEYEWVDAYPIVVNDLEMTEIAFNAVEKTCGPNHAYYGEAFTGSEDFSYISREVPACFLFLGAGSDEDGLHFINHHPKFNVKEECIELGAKTHVQLALDFLNK